MNIEINEKNIAIDNSVFPKGIFSVTKLKDCVRIESVTTADKFDIKVGVTIDDVVFNSLDAIHTELSDKLFKNGGGTTGGGVESVTGGLVNNSDPLNPKVNLPSGGTSTTYLKGDNTWGTPPNTTYTVITEAEFNTGTASTARTVSAASLKRDVRKGFGERIAFGTATADSAGDFTVTFPSGKFTTAPHIQLTALISDDVSTLSAMVRADTVTKDGFSGELFSTSAGFTSGEVNWLAIEL